MYIIQKCTFDTSTQLQIYYNNNIIVFNKNLSHLYASSAPAAI